MAELSQLFRSPRRSVPGRRDRKMTRNAPLFDPRPGLNGVAGTGRRIREHPETACRAVRASWAEGVDNSPCGSRLVQDVTPSGDGTSQDGTVPGGFSKRHRCARADVGDGWRSLR